eukprot:scaffold204299_cov14-Tisochrysis_lutea.AAC.1
MCALPSCKRFSLGKLLKDLDRHHFTQLLFRRAQAKDLVHILTAKVMAFAGAFKDADTCLGQVVQTVSPEHCRRRRWAFQSSKQVFSFPNAAAPKQAAIRQVKRRYRSLVHHLPGRWSGPAVPATDFSMLTMLPPSAEQGRNSVTPSARCTLSVAGKVSSAVAESSAVAGSTAAPVSPSSRAAAAAAGTDSGLGLERPFPA